MAKETKETKEFTVPLTLNIDKFWIEYCTQYSDLFYTNRCGYWMRGVERTKARGWLAYESGGEVSPGEEPFLKEAKKAWREGTKLPPGYFVINEDTAIKAWVEGVKRYGVDWYDDIDANREDVVMQLALLGDIKYS